MGGEKFARVHIFNSCAPITECEALPICRVPEELRTQRSGGPWQRDLALARWIGAPRPERGAAGRAPVRPAGRVPRGRASGGYQLGGAEAGGLARAAEDRVEHRWRDPPGEGVLLARVIAAEQ